MATKEVLLPLILLGLAFLLKLVVDRSANVPDVISAVLALPVDIAFLSASLIVGYTISQRADIENGMVHFCIYIVGAVGVVFFWRRSESSFLADHYVWSVAFCLLNYAICIYGLTNAIRLMSSLMTNAIH